MEPILVMFQFIPTIGVFNQDKTFIIQPGSPPPPPLSATVLKSYFIFLVEAHFIYVSL